MKIMNKVSIASLLPPALRGPLTLVAATIVTVVCFAAIAAPWLTPYSPNAMDLNGVLQAPSWTHLAGTDELGRDLLTRILHGARPSMAAAFGIVGIGTAFGLLIGTLSGLLSGWFDTVVMRLTDVVLALPGLVVALALTAALGPSLFNAVVALGLLAVPAYIRVARGQTLALRETEYVLAARIIGVSSARLMRKHILPNTLTPVMVAATLNLGLAILSEATLSFLGVGMPITQPSLGTLIRIGNQYLFSGSWWLVVFPALHLGLVVLAVNLLGDWLRDAMNPKLR